MLGDGGGPRPDGLRPPREEVLLLVLAGGGGRFPAGAGRGGEPLLLVAAAPGFFIFGGGADLLSRSESAAHSPGEPPEDEKSTRTLCPERFTIFPVFPAILACCTAAPGFASTSDSVIALELWQFSPRRLAQLLLLLPPQRWHSTIPAKSPMNKDLDCGSRRGEVAKYHQEASTQETRDETNALVDTDAAIKRTFPPQKQQNQQAAHE